MSVKNMKSKVIVLAENAKTSPSKLFRFLNSLDYDIKVKETCFGALIEGDPLIVDEVVEKVRNLEPNRIFCRDRGFPIWDERRCRAFRKGGPREGFHQLEKEQSSLEIIGKSLDKLEKGEIDLNKIEERYLKMVSKNKPVSVDLFKKIVERVVECGGKE